MSKQSKSIPALITLFLACFGDQAMAENLQGYTKGFITPQIGVPQNRALLLQSFYFRFTNANHHFGSIKVAPILRTVFARGCQMRLNNIIASVLQPPSLVS